MTQLLYPSEDKSPVKLLSCAWKHTVYPGVERVNGLIKLGSGGKTDRLQLYDGGVRIKYCVHCEH